MHKKLKNIQNIGSSKTGEKTVWWAEMVEVMGSTEWDSPAEAERG